MTRTASHPPTDPPTDTVEVELDPIDEELTDDELLPGAPWGPMVAWAGIIVVLLVASGGPVWWARAELADVTVPPERDIWIQLLFVVGCGLVVAFSEQAREFLRHDRGAVIAVGVFLVVLLASTIWSVDSARTFEQWLLLGAASAAALLGGVTLDRIQVLTALFVALHVGIAVSLFADLRDWPAGIVGGDLAGVFGTSDGMGMIALLAAAATVMVMVVLLTPTPEERRAAAEARAESGGADRRSLIASIRRTYNSARRMKRMADVGVGGPGGIGTGTARSQVRRLQAKSKRRRRQMGALGGVRSSGPRRLAVAVVLLGVLVLDGFAWWRSQSYGALFAVVAAALVMLVVALALPGPGESTRRAAAGSIAVLVIAAVVVLIVLRETVADWFDRDATWSGRTTVWDAALDAARDRPIHGFGFASGGGFPIDPRSGLFQVALGAGLLGLVALAWLVMVAFRRTIAAAMERPDALSVWVVGLVAYGLAANVNESFVSAFSLPWLLLVLGLGHAVRRREERYEGALT